MIKSKRRFYYLIGCGSTLFFLAIAVWIGICLLNRPPYLMPDTTRFETGDIFFSVGDSWESVAVRALSGTRSLEVADSTPSHCGIVIRNDDGVKLVHASTVAKRSSWKQQKNIYATTAHTASIPGRLPVEWTPWPSERP